LPKTSGVNRRTSGAAAVYSEPKEQFAGPLRSAATMLLSSKNKSIDLANG
jgi:hypothetical protein